MYSVRRIHRTAVIKEEDPATTQDTLNMCQIPAPSYKEEKKAEYIRERFREIGLRDVRIDAWKCAWDLAGNR